MRTDLPRGYLVSKLATITLSRRIYELLMTPLDPDLEVAVLFALLGLAVSVAAMRVSPLTAYILALQMPC
jgi:H+/Cl- antiporter ClcA